MTNLTRRAMLCATLIGTGAMLSTAAVAATAAPAFAFADPEPGENPELLSLGRAIPALEAEYIAARRARAAAIAKGSRIWPAAPDDLCHPSHGVWGVEIERDITGHGITRPGQKDCFRVTTADEIQAYIDDIRGSIRRKRNPATPINVYGALGSREEWEQEMGEQYVLLATAETYEAEKARILKVFGYTAATKRRCAAEEALLNAVAAVMAQQETSPAGVLIKARALKAWGRLDPLARLLPSGAFDWPSQLAASVLQFMGEAAA